MKGVTIGDGAVIGAGSVVTKDVPAIVSRWQSCKSSKNDRTMKIAVIYTCFNRKAKTLASLESVFNSVDYYNSHIFQNQIEVEVFLTDDGCTDGTSDAIREKFPDKLIHIFTADGSLFWARGMCIAWKEAMKRHGEWNHYLLMNDDTNVNLLCFGELLKTHEYCISHFSTGGIYSGITCAPDDPQKITYGGTVIFNRLTGKGKRLGRSEQPQMVDMTNANILLVPAFIVNEIGIFYNGFHHGAADYDYTMTARRKGIPVLITANVCGECENDHGDSETVKKRIVEMSLSERKAYFKHPLHSADDYLTMVRRNMPLRYPISWMFYLLRLYCPGFYYKINRARGV